MKSNKRLLVFLVVICVCVPALWLSVSVGQGRRQYEVETQVYGVPEYRSDAARAIDAYERLMDRYMDLTERNLFSVSADVRLVVTKLDAVHAELAGLSARLARIERHLGIQPDPAAVSGGATNTPSPPSTPRDALRPSSPQP
jgi:hypothetical protein